jgi:replicative DNA helicase
MTHRQMRLIQDWIPAAASLIALLGVVVTAAMSYQRLETITEQARDVNAAQDAAIEAVRSDYTTLMRSIDQRLSRIEGRIEEQTHPRR